MVPTQPDDRDHEPQSGPDWSKVGRVTEKYGLAGMAEELERRWRGERRERQSLRDLAEFFNQRVLESAVEATEEPVIDGEIANYYELLTGDDVPRSARTQAETKLGRSGVDVESVRSDFVTHQAIYSYLTKVRDVSPPDTDRTADESVAGRRTTIERLRNRLSAVTATSLRELSNAGAITVGSFDVLVTVQVHCQDCGSTRAVGDLLDAGSCDCS